MSTVPDKVGYLFLCRYECLFVPVYLFRCEAAGITEVLVHMAVYLISVSYTHLPEAAASNVKQGQYSPRKRKDTTPRVNPQLAVELVYQELITFYQSLSRHSMVFLHQIFF